MSFTDKQAEMLGEKLNPKHVKKLGFGAKKGCDYIEGWHAIDTANRIFGHDGWTSETMRMECTSTQNYTKRDNYNNRDVPMIEVGYLAIIRVSAGGVFHEGTGFGMGQAKRLGDAHESASKEAETDAIKRALIKYGYPFGLALYDKAKANVGVSAPVKNSASKTSEKTRNLYKQAEQEIFACDGDKKLLTLLAGSDGFKEMIEVLPNSFQDEIRKIYKQELTGE